MERRIIIMDILGNKYYGEWSKGEIKIDHTTQYQFTDENNIFYKFCGHSVIYEAIETRNID